MALGTVDFAPPSYRAASSDLTISISPLGLVELADEEFEVHGPRLNRYSLNFAMYLGHHYAYKREAGEPQVVLNYYRALTDYVARFTFGKGIHFRSPKATEAIIPDRLERVWEEDNDKESVLLEMAQLGGVTGDCFVKVAYEEPWTDGTGRFHPGRVRILPLNSSFAFPEFHSHDRDRLLRFKLKYRFWGTSLEGTRQVFTYTEIVTDDTIEEYINDELISQRENPLGMVYVVHIPNLPVAGSPWGLPDCHDIISINRQYNETYTDIADIVNYHAAPITVITGAKASQLERGAKKVWGGLPKDATVQNLEGGAQGLDLALKYLEQLKRAMHELTGVPETALGQMQPISNTSGVALSIQFQPLMNRHQQKVIQYTKGLKRINELIIRTLAVKEPEALVYNPDTDGPIKEGQYTQLDPNDPITYITYPTFPPPLPLDQLVLLNEISMRISMDLESKEGALRKLGEEFPEEKLQEIRKEMQEDALAAGALSLITATIQSEIMELTGVMPGPDGQGGTPMQGGVDEMGNPLPAPQLLDPAIQENVQNQLLTMAYGTKLPQRRIDTGSDAASEKL